MEAPTELRNRIYEYCLKAEYLYGTGLRIDLHSDRIIVHKQLKALALLSTCRQVRNEASHIWYLANRFTIDIIDYDATLFVAWKKQVEEKLVSKPDTSTEIMYEAHWENLKQWCR